MNVTHNFFPFPFHSLTFFSQVALIRSAAVHTCKHTVLTEKYFTFCTVTSPHLLLKSEFWVRFGVCVPAGRARRPPETGTLAWTRLLCASGPTGTSHQSGCSSEWLDRTLRTKRHHSEAEPSACAERVDRGALLEGLSVTQKHLEQFLVLQHDGSFHQILEVRVDPGTDPSVLSDPLLRLDVDVVSHLDSGRGRRLNLNLHFKAARVHSCLQTSWDPVENVNRNRTWKSFKAPKFSEKSHQTGV